MLGTRAFSRDILVFSHLVVANPSLLKASRTEKTRLPRFLCLKRSMPSKAKQLTWAAPLRLPFGYAFATWIHLQSFGKNW